MSPITIGVDSFERKEPNWKAKASLSCEAFCALIWLSGLKRVLS